MRLKEMESLAYRLEKEKKDSGRGAIVFIGAGASVTGNIPLANQIVKDILKEHSDSPDIKALSEANQKDYYELMGCLTAKERKDLFKKYINESKINASHIYLAKLMDADYVDYILTVNFDDLLLQALALYGKFPATYDIAMLKGLTTARFDAPGVVYLHGRHNGINLINTKDEFKEVRALIVDSLKKLEDRPWIVVGYGASDPVFEYMKDLKKFESNLYWICYKDNDPSNNVIGFLKEHSFNAYSIKGYDSDEFFVALHNELGLDEPTFISQPFTHMKNIHDGLVDIKIEGSKHERFEITKKWVGDAIKKYEHDEGDVEGSEEIKIDKITNSLYTAIVNGDFDKFSDIERQNIDNKEHLIDILSTGYNSWGNMLTDKGNSFTGNKAISAFNNGFEKYKKAIELTPNHHEIYNNWGIALRELAGKVPLEKAEPLLNESFEKYKKATEINPDYSNAYHNWGLALQELAENLPLEKAEPLLNESFEKYKKALEIKPDKFETYNNWGIAQSVLAIMLPAEKAVALLNESFEKYEKAVEIKPDYHEAYNNWGAAINELANKLPFDKAEPLFNGIFEKYEKAVEIKPDYHTAYNNWGAAIHDLADKLPFDKAEPLFNEGFEKYEKAIEIKPNNYKAYENWGISIINLYHKKSNKAEKIKLLNDALNVILKSIEYGGSKYNLACIYALLNEKEKAFDLLTKILEEKEKEFSFIEQDNDWNLLRDEEKYKQLKEKYLK